MADVSELHLVTGMDQLAAIVPKSLLPERVCTTTDFHHSPNRFSQRRTKIKQDGTRTPYDYFNSPHTCYSTLTTSFLPPVDLQKGRRDAQVQFRGRRHTYI
ncbi:hypothetical protein T03_4179 [Trichinella britovi]|uniref:Uncharacterized protein n=1 Tax=Trichinella britovi TaxID=45882 RepID=A0A0V1C7J0_TRIBR|nr:hypothetical protein T03_4179 [Trichinella britovi]